MRKREMSPGMLALQDEYRNNSDKIVAYKARRKDPKLKESYNPLELRKMSYDQRHLHIAYSELLGRNRSQIEQHTRYAERVDEKYITRIKEGMMKT